MFHLRFFTRWMKLVKLFLFNMFFFSFCVTFSWINIICLIIVLDWFTTEWFLSPCLFVRNKITWKNIPVFVIFISWWKGGIFWIFCTNLNGRRPLCKNNLSSRKLQILCTGGYQLSFLLVKQYADMEKIFAKLPLLLSGILVRMEARAYGQ